MGDRRLLASGEIVADRYELQDLVSEKLGSSMWRAHDKVLNRNVGLEILATADPRAERFLDAARQSTIVTDPRFLRVLDVIENEKGQNLIIREWAKAFPLDQLLLQSPLPNRRAATVVAEVAEAMAHAHEMGIFHRRLTPHQVVLKQSGAVRVVGLGVASALSPGGARESIQDLQAYERADVEALGKLLYACLTSRWPGAHTDGLRAAPTEHGRLLRPRQVRAGVSRDADTVCDRILGRPPRNHHAPLRTAQEVGAALRLAGDDESFLLDDQPSLAGLSSPDLLRLDPVIVPAGPAPGNNPPRRRPKAFEPAPPTTFERNIERAKGATRGDRAFIVGGIIGTLVLLTIIGFMVGRTTNANPDPIKQSSPLRMLPIRSAQDFDPQGQDKAENPAEVKFAIDGNLSTGWRSSQYFGNARLGGLKDGVGLSLDLGGPREVETLRIRFTGSGTSFAVYASAPETDKAPTSLKGLRRIAVLTDAGEDSTITLQSGVLTRRLVIWLTKLPKIGDNTFRGQINEITIRGKS